MRLTPRHACGPSVNASRWVSFTPTPYIHFIRLPNHTEIKVGSGYLSFDSRTMSLHFTGRSCVGSADTAISDTHPTIFIINFLPFYHFLV